MTNARGIDCSVYQTTTPPLAGLSFLFARASIGLNIDARYGQHIAKARAAGLVTGAYHFGTAAKVSAQVSTFLDAAGQPDLFALDLEHSSVPMSATQAREFIAAVQQTGRRIGLYHSDSGFPSLGQDWSWVANWSASPSHSWDFWQYRGSPLDLDEFRGTDAELRSWVANVPDTGVADMQVATLTFWQAANAKAGKPVRDKAGAVIHTTPSPPKTYPLVGTDGADYVIRLPGDVVGWIAKTDVGSISEPGPVPPLPAPDCTTEVAAAVAPVQHELDLANSRIHKAVIDLGGTP